MYADAIAPARSARPDRGARPTRGMIAARRPPALSAYADGPAGPPLGDPRVARVPVGQRLVRARRGKDGVLLPGASHELDARGQSPGAEAVGHADGRQPRAVSEGAHDVLRGGADRAPELLPEHRRLVDPSRRHQRVEAPEHTVYLPRHDTAEPHGLDVVLGEDGIACVGRIAVLWRGQPRDATRLDQVLEGARRLDLENRPR